MYCEDCALWDSEAAKCKNGKLNPADWGGAVSVANVYGLRAICVFNDFRERLILSRAATCGESAAEPQDQCIVPTGSDNNTA
ncbi:MAG: hypothetical protein QY327_08230 [Fimbriimonadaceae bacterium]|uniref:Uncharacterized protein n=1 Tax=Candidatus Nitrosymbiomonas proteolyticus TaxID=2608984 RepID=A0A809S8Q7_9BACT|nr:MAG: hypothetical protein EDM74_04435 [Armatimonadota bacterium]KXK10496.1 MAG: hypothetical protein UZ18_ATM001002475 [Armatimonadetes bacterium OLB18]MCK6630802.1 hypothetical protein [Fimbriimonadaceae bacterium]BBO23111.1 conserved hypothetical protein [Candidatus Nitrosymbiomonas proteolyticus]NUM38362.1 hypothetical protein [Armatimonadota bacterium]